MNAVEKAVSIMGSQTALANKLKITPQAVNNWLVMGQVPINRVIGIEKATNKKVTRYQLRPDIFGDVE
jgi:DNA-binding transcriptional regulator YdaS (Cro superfamily)